MNNENVTRIGPKANPELVAQARKEMEDSALSQGKAAKEVGVSETRFSQWLNDRYPGDNAAMNAQVETWLSSRAARRATAAALPAAPDWYDTHSARRITAALTYAQMAADLVVIHGGAGVGKSKTLRRHAETNPNVWIIESTPTTNTLGGFLRNVAYTLGHAIPPGHGDVLELSLRDRLRGTNGLLVVDEAQFLNERALEAARRIAELSGVGLALVGNDTVYAQLTGRNRAAEFAQLFSRIGKRVRLTRPAPADVEAACDAWHITGRAERDLLSEIAKRPGALRIVTKTLRLASLFAKGGEVNIEHIRAAWKDLGGE